MNRFAEIAERIAARPTDSKGEPIRPIGEYVLRLSTRYTSRKWYGGGSLIGNSVLVDDENDADIVRGGRLLDVIADMPDVVNRWEIIRWE